MSDLEPIIAKIMEANSATSGQVHELSNHVLNVKDKHSVIVNRITKVESAQNAQAKLSEKESQFFQKQIDMVVTGIKDIKKTAWQVLIILVTILATGLGFYYTLDIKRDEEFKKFLLENIVTKNQDK